jgi:hypothetical protein
MVGFLCIGMSGRDARMIRVTGVGDTSVAYGLRISGMRPSHFSGTTRQTAMVVGHDGKQLLSTADNVTAAIAVCVEIPVAPSVVTDVPDIRASTHKYNVGIHRGNDVRIVGRGCVRRHAYTNVSCYRRGRYGNRRHRDGAGRCRLCCHGDVRMSRATRQCNEPGGHSQAVAHYAFVQIRSALKL